MTSLVLAPAPLRWATPAPAARAPAPTTDAQAAAAVDAGWFFDLLGADVPPRHVALRPAPVGSPPHRYVWLMLAVPLLVPAQLAVLGLLRIVVPGWWVLAGAAAALVLLAHADARGLAAHAVSAPPLRLALLPPLYLRARGRAAVHPVPPFAWGLAAAGGLLVATALGPVVSPVPLRSAQVEGQLLQQVLDQRITLDPGTATVTCPRFERVWIDSHVLCTGRDATTRLTFRVTPLDRAGNLAWEVLPA